MSRKPILAEPIKRNDGDLIFPVKKNYEAIEQDLKHLTGEILTIIDASISKGEQNKAIKDLIKEKFRGILSNYQWECSEGQVGHSINFN